MLLTHPNTMPRVTGGEEYLANHTVAGLGSAALLEPLEPQALAEFSQDLDLIAPQGSLFPAEASGRDTDVNAAFQSKL